MAKLTDDPRVAAAIEKAEQRGQNNERRRINGLVADAKRSAGDLEDSGQKKAVKSALTDLSGLIRG